MAFSVQWTYGHDSSTTSQASPNGDEVVFDYSAGLLVDLGAPTSKLLQLSVIRHGGGAADELIGILLIDLSAHVPKPPQQSSRQRATLAMSRCPYQPNVMVRLMVETAFVESPLRVGLGGRAGSSSRARSGSAVGGDRVVDTAPEPAHHEELERLRASLATISATNKHLRDENALLKVAAQRAREEPGYTYQALRDAGGRPQQSPTPTANLARSNLEDLQSMDVMRAEIAVLQRGLSAAKAQIREDKLVEEELRLEVESLVKTTRFNMDEIRRLEQEVEASRGTRALAAESHSSAQALRAQLLDAQDTNRDQRRELETAKKDVEVLRASLDEADRALRIELEKRKKLEADCNMQIQSARAEADRAKAALQVGQQELSSLHRYCTELGERWKSVADVVEAQRHSIEKKNERILELRSLLRGMQVQQRIGDDGSA